MSNWAMFFGGGVMVGLNFIALGPVVALIYLGVLVVAYRLGRAIGW